MRALSFMVGLVALAAMGCNSSSTTSPPTAQSLEADCRAQNARLVEACGAARDISSMCPTLAMGAIAYGCVAEAQAALDCSRTKSGSDLCTSCTTELSATLSCITTGATRQDGGVTDTGTQPTDSGTQTDTGAPDSSQGGGG